MSINNNLLAELAVWQVLQQLRSTPAKEET
jgi:hypothetical protein